PLGRAPRHPEILVEPLIRCLRSNVWPRSVAETLLGYAQAHLLDGEQRRASAAAVAPRLSHLLDNLSNRDMPDNEDAYHDMRDVQAEAGLLLDLVGALQVDEGRTVLTAAARHRSAWLSMWGALGLVRLGVAAPVDAFERAAADPESRSVLFNQ